MDNKEISKNIQEIVTLEIGRYLSIAKTNEDREKAYPRLLFEQRVQELVQQELDKYLK